MSTTRSSRSTPENPLNYWCAPNGASPSYVPARDFRDFVAYGLWRANTESDGWESLAGSPEDTYWLRRYFLDCVEFALRIHRRKNRPGNLHEDLGDRGDFGLFLQMRDAEHAIRCDRNEVYLRWVYEGRCGDGHWCFVLFCSGADDDVLWLDDDAPNDRPLCWRVLAEARQAIEASRRPCAESR